MSLLMGVGAYGVDELVERAENAAEIAEAAKDQVANRADMTRTSTSLVTVSNGPKTFAYATSKNLGWTLGMRLRATAASGYVEGEITAVSPTAVTINVTSTVGSGSYDNWAIGIVGNPGFNWRGAWTAKTYYNKNDGVSYGDPASSWIRNTSGGETEETFDATQWDKFAQGGGVAAGSVGRAELDSDLSALLQELPDTSGYLYVITDSAKQRVLGIRRDGWVDGRFQIEELNIRPNSVNSAAIKSSSVLVNHLAEEVRNKFLGDNNVLLTNLAQDVLSLLLKNFTNDGREQMFTILDAQNQMVFQILTNGQIKGRWDYSQAPIAYSDLQADLQTRFAVDPFDNTYSRYYLVIPDENKNVAFGITKDGWVEGRVRLMDKTVRESMLGDDLLQKVNVAVQPSFKRLNDSNPNDTEVIDDDYWRGVSASVDLKTEVSGYGFARFPSTPVKGLRGFNTTGTTLQFRPSYGLAIHGKRYRGVFNPTSAGLTLSTYKGNYGNAFTNVYPAFPVGAVGDFYVANVSGTATRTANGLTFKNGDLIVQTGSSTFSVQPGPGTGDFQEGDFWNVTANSKYADLSLMNGHRLIYIGVQSASGPKYVQFVPSVAGEFFYMGEVTSNAFAPVVAARQGDIYVFAGSYTAQGIPGVEGDYLIYDGGWGLVPGMVSEFADGTYIMLEADNANRWDVRRKDKSATPVSLSLTTFRTSVRRKPTDNVVLFSDSMFGVATIGTTIVNSLVAGGRVASYFSYGGGTSRDVLAMIKKKIRTESDPFAGNLHVFWHGQNNQTDIVQIKNAALELVPLVGASQKKYVFWSVLGQYTATWNGSRIVIAIHEDAVAGTNHIAQIEQWYTLMFPKRWFCPRQAMLNAALTSSVPHALFPGLAESQVAMTYGIPPHRYFFDYTGKSFTPATLNFVGYQSAAGLPSGGNSNDYYIRVANGTIGQIIVNVAGTWTEYTYDPVHPVNEGGVVLASSFLNFLTTNNL
ncbi:hypothetical protein GCM10028806_28610 [Spirosoma terrae]|uniref:Uncharacterized protein n=1 Tax=Spirosoma terrae TaxID=1968276 RepID=A0A6L9LFA6_9BACT|nr:hypothetical protein [Spirosoma terrae]NDU97178.1 hypothetical protein [Spirosoma terrae]